MPAVIPAAHDIYTISRLNREVRNVLEDVFPAIWVQGEISNLARPGSGHIYFTLKDSSAQVRCAMFKNRQSGLRFQPENGMEVLAQANISLYEGRGEFQLIIESLQPAGDGALQLAFEQLKKKLDAEGLFAEEHKQPIPRFPARIGIITSPTGAAIRDILSVLKRRYPYGEVVVYPVPVQGEGAGNRIARAIQTADQRKDCDVLILTRGGGSLEDLWSFNEEIVARAIYECELPIVSGVGHEIDFSIADFVADQRAPTPSVAAELVSPDSARLIQQLERYRDQLIRNQDSRLMQWQRHVDYLSRQIPHPRQHLQQLGQRTREYLVSMSHCMERLLSANTLKMSNLRARVNEQNPYYKIKQQQQTLASIQKNLGRAVKQQLVTHRQTLAMLEQKLETIGPLSTLERGYAIVTDKQSGALIKQGSQIKAGDQIAIRLAKEEIESTVNAIHKK
ncbi:MAG: exodeoxyribonuclease VII large subunit [Gammaproteobacteria bacterium]